MELDEGELENEFFDRADSVAFSLAAAGASPDDIVDELKRLLSQSDPRLKEEIPESELESLATWAVERRGPKVENSMSIAA